MVNVEERLDENGIIQYFREGIKLKKGIKIGQNDIDNHKELYEFFTQIFTAYPDLFIDLITPVKSNFQLFPYQRIFLRASLRYRYQYLVAPRAFSKSFVAILAMMLKSIFQPGGKFFICAPKKEQTAKIAIEKIDEILGLFPLLRKELLGEDYNRGSDYVRMIFKNGSIFDVVGALDTTRGGRRNGGIIDEVRDHDPDSINQIVLPLMNVDRKTASGIINPKEPHQEQIWLTSAGCKGSYAYQKLIELLVMSIMSPKTAFVWGCDYRVPVMHNLISKQYINEIKMSPTFKEDDFAREYCGVWTGGNSDSWFNYDRLLTKRQILTPEKSQKLGAAKDAWYLLSVDVARLKCQTIVSVFKVYPRDGYFFTKLVNIFVKSNANNNTMHFLEQANFLKQIIDDFNPREVVIDGNGLGVGLLDFMVIETVDKNGVTRPAIGCTNSDDYERIQPKGCKKLIYVLKATAKLNSEIHGNCYTQISNGKVALLATEREIKSRLMETKKGMTMSAVKRNERILPHELTTRLIEEMLNLKLKSQGTEIELEQMNKRMTKDKFSSFEYGLWRVKFYEDQYFITKKKQRANAGKQLVFFTKRG